MQRVKMLTILCGPDLTAGPGQVVEVTEARAAALVDGGFAELVEPAPAAAPPAAPPVGKPAVATGAAIVDLNAREAAALVGEAQTVEDVDALLAAEEANPKHKGGRVSVLRALEARREDIAGVDADAAAEADGEADEEGLGG